MVQVQLNLMQKLLKCSCSNSVQSVFMRQLAIIALDSKPMQDSCAHKSSVLEG